MPGNEFKHFQEKSHGTPSSIFLVSGYKITDNTEGQRKTKKSPISNEAFLFACISKTTDS